MRIFCLRIGVWDSLPWIFTFCLLFACASHQPRSPIINHEPPAPTPPKNWCSYFAAGASSTEPIPLALSRAHAIRRFFGVNKYSQTDQALAATLENQTIAKQVNLTQYANALSDTCWLPTQKQVIPRLKIQFNEGILRVSPGRGNLNLPPSARALVVELPAPSTAEVDSSFLDLLSYFLADDIQLPTQAIRTHHGMTDEFFFPRNVYHNRIEKITQTPIRVRGKYSGPIFFVVSGPLSPRVIEIIAALRLAKRAYLVGGDLSISAAESIWLPMGKSGIATRVKEFYSGESRWPDFLEQDFSKLEMENLLSQSKEWPKAKEVQSTPHREELSVIQPFREKQPATKNLGDIRAALLSAHGALRLFFPDFRELGDRIDSQLLRSLKEIKTPNGSLLELEKRHLRLLSASLHDGHSFVFSENDKTEHSYAPLALETIGGRAYVRRSSVAGINPGDEIVKKGKKSIRNFYKEALPLISASTPGYRYDIANRDLVRLNGPTEFTVAGDGRRTVIVQPIPFSKVRDLQPGVPSLRKSGWLDDKEEIYYLNFNSTVTPTMKDFYLSLEEVKEKQAKLLVLDMRGYPDLDMDEVARHLICKDFSSPVYRFVEWKGPEKRTTNDEKSNFMPQKNSYCGPIALLVGPHTVSASENFSTVLVDAKRVKVYGKPSAGSNGNIAGIQLPGGFVLTFSGMEVLHADGSVFAGRGIHPDKIIPLSSKDLKEGRDPDLLAAIRTKAQLDLAAPSQSGEPIP